jgi:alkylated DNA repair dioxygenase AlkB
MAYLHEPPVDYLYAGLTLPGASLNDDIHGLIVLFKEKLTLDFNSVLLNYYQDGKDKINWHSDKEDQLGINPIIGSLNLGATRKFHFLRKSTGEKLSVDLSHGDFFVMESGCQENFLHAILPEKHVKDPRISLTFRRVVC